MRFFFLFFLCCSCHFHQREIPAGFPLEISNVYANPTYPHQNIFNVLLLPIDNPMQSHAIAFHQQELAMALLRNFGHYNYFYIHFDPSFSLKTTDVINLNRGSVDRLKLGGLQEQYNVQAMLVISLVDFVPFFPMRVKLKAALIDANTAERIWEFDHVFNMRDGKVMDGMRYWWNKDIAGADKRRKFADALQQPAFFSDFIFHTLAKSYAIAREENIRLVKEAKERWEEQKAS